MYACTSTNTLIQEVTSPRFVRLSRGVSVEVRGVFACALTRTGAGTANHSLNGVISDKYEAIITADVFLDHNYLLILQRAQSGSPSPGRSRYATIAFFLSFFICYFLSCFTLLFVFRQFGDATPQLLACLLFPLKEWIVVSSAHYLHDELFYFFFFIFFFDKWKWANVEHLDHFWKLTERGGLKKQIEKAKESLLGGLSRSTSPLFPRKLLYSAWRLQ